MLELHATMNVTRQSSSRVVTDIMIELTNLPPTVFANQYVAIPGTEKQRFVRIWFVISGI
jgi:hypothetical protein